MKEYAIAIDIGGSHVEYGIVHEDQLIAAETIQVHETTLLKLLPQLTAGIRALIAKCQLDLTTVSGVAVGICAIADGQSKVLATSGKYNDSVGFDFALWAQKEFGLNCRVENDARMALLGEHFCGAATGADDAVLVTLGTGIGGAVLLGGKLLQSRGHKAGGLAGHLGVALNGRTCGCGNRGCAEAEASTASLDFICREHIHFAESLLAKSTTAINFHALFAAVDVRDPVACAVLDHCVAVWSALTVSLIHAYDPQVIVFAGGVMHRHEDILVRIQAHVDRYAWAEKGSIQIVLTRLGSSAALLGALPLLRTPSPLVELSPMQNACA